MLGAFLTRPGALELREVPLPQPGPGEVLVRVEAALTCGTDLKLFRRGHPKIPLPAPMGHEAAGVVAATGAGVRGLREGDPVAWAPSAPCGGCRLCSRGRENLCAQAVGRLALGAFAEYLLLPRHVAEANLFLRPASLPAAEAAALEPLACVLHGASRVALARAETIVFLGDGPISHLFLQVVRRSGPARILVVGRHQTRLAVAAALGADTLPDPRDDAKLRERVRTWTGGGGADVVVEAVGRPDTWEAAAGLVAAGGELLLYGGCEAGTRASLDTQRLHYEEVDVRGAFHYRRADARAAFDLLVAGEIEAAPLVTHERPLADLEQALGLVLRREAVKVALRP